MFGPGGSAAGPKPGRDGFSVKMGGARQAEIRHRTRPPGRASVTIYTMRRKRTRQAISAPDAAKLEIPPAELDTDEPNGTAETKVCSFCKEDVRKDATRCPYCTSAVRGDDDDRRVIYIVDRDLIRFGKFAGAIFALFVVMGVYAFGFKIEVAFEHYRRIQAETEKLTPMLRGAKTELAAARQELEDARRVSSTLARELEGFRDTARTKITLIEGYVASFQRQLTPEQQRHADEAAAQLRTTPPRLPKLWPNGSALTIRFMDGTPELAIRVRKHMEEWLKYTNLNIRQVDAGNAMVRVTFQPPGAWAYIGTDALGVAQDQPTVTLGGLTMATSDDEMRRMVLHEFGHVLGLVDESENPNVVIPWNKEVMYRELSQPPTSWSREQIDRAFFARPSPVELRGYRGFDPASIMMTEVPARWTDGKIQAGKNRDLSPSDKAFVATLYPR